MDRPPISEYRNASRVDVGLIFSILTSLSAEIPVRMDTEERRQRIREIVDSCCDQQTSWIVLGETGEVVGFLLGERYSTRGMPGIEFEGVALRYGGVLMEHRRHGYFSGLLDRAKTMQTPLHAVVKRANKSQMAARLINKGFVEMADFARFPDEDVFIWTPQ